MSNEGKKVKTHYKGTLDDGTQFDSASTAANRSSSPAWQAR